MSYAIRLENERGSPLAKVDGPTEAFNRSVAGLNPSTFPWLSAAGPSSDHYGSLSLLPWTGHPGALYGTPAPQVRTQAPIYASTAVDAPIGDLVNSEMQRGR
jgi:hypothetical protein